MKLDQNLKSEIQKAVTALFNQQVEQLQIQPTNQKFEGSHMLVCFAVRRFAFIVILLLCFDLPAQDFQPGRYYTQKNERIDGLLSHRVYRSKKGGPSNLIVFKKDKDSFVEQITIKEAKAFVAGKDSFATASGFFATRYFTEDFAKVIKKGKISLYLHYSDVLVVSAGVANGFIPYAIPHGKTVKTYLIGRAGGYWMSAINQDNFKNKIESLFFDDAEMLQKFKKGKYKFKNLEALIEEYNLRWKNKT